MVLPLRFDHEIAIVAILKDEGRYISEWLDYHKTIGVTKFYLYDNDSRDNIREILTPHIKSGLVEYNYFPGKFMQMAAYNDALKRHRFHCRYLAIIDLDEFIYPRGKKNLPQQVAELLAPWKDAGGLTMNWRFFGSSGEEEYDPNRGVLERFTRRGVDMIYEHQAVKTIVNPRAVKLIAHPHYAIYLPGKYAVDEDGTPVPAYENPRCPTAKICLNH